MAILPVKKIPAIKTYAYSTCPTIFKGQALVLAATGYVTNSLSNYATSQPIVGVAAEQKATAASLATSYTIKVWPVNPETTWEASCSGTAALAGIGSVCNLQAAHRGVQYSATAVTTGGSFVIEEIVSSSKMRGRLIDTLLNGRRTPNFGGTT